MQTIYGCRKNSGKMTMFKDMGFNYGKGALRDEFFLKPEGENP
ncbi:MAG: hypothetical protein SV062_01955 [Thermodesulfobacteriota bacterium]|nr:hypothetical protein [Thermodesulfobacteriota bacterium]